MTSLTVPIGVLMDNDWKIFAKKMFQLGRLTDEEIDPRTWKKSLAKAGIVHGGDLSALILKTEGKPYLLITFELVAAKNTRQRITFGGSDVPIKFSM